MFTSDKNQLRKIAAGLERVLVMDPSANSAKLMVEVMRDIGARHVQVINKTTQGVEPVANFDPQLILTELSGPDFNGLEFIRNLRRSRIAARTAPVILYTAEATVESIKGARDAGAHEFLRKPYTLKDLFRRVENVIIHPRDWIEAKMYVGPDRRRFNSESYSGARKRQVEKTSAA